MATSFPAANSPTVNAKTNLSLSKRLENYRLVKDLTYESLGLLCGVSRMTIVRACQGQRLTSRIAHKIKTFLKDVNA